MDIHPHMHGTSTAERVQDREELRQVLKDVETLPETQRTALLLREIDQMSYEEIAVAMETTIPAVKSLLVRARITLAESSESRTLSCEEVRVTLAEAAEGLTKASGPVRLHVRNCESCANFRKQLRNDSKALAALSPVPLLVALKTSLFGKLFGGTSAGGSTAATTTGGTASTAGGIAATGGAAGGIGAIGSVLGTKAVAGVATATLLAAGAVQVSDRGSSTPEATPEPIAQAAPEPLHAPQAASPATTFEKRKVNAVAAASTPADNPARERLNNSAQANDSAPAPQTAPPEPEPAPAAPPEPTTPVETEPEQPGIVVEESGTGQPSTDGETSADPTPPVIPPGTTAPPYEPPTTPPATPPANETQPGSSGTGGSPNGVAQPVGAPTS